MATFQHHTDLNSFDMAVFDSYDSMHNYYNIPAAYYAPSQFMSAMPDVALKHEMLRANSCDGSLATLSHVHEHPPTLASSASAASLPSACSSTIGSPYIDPQHSLTSHDSYSTDATFSAGYFPAIVNHDGYSHEMITAGLEAEIVLSSQNKSQGDFVDPSLISASQYFNDGLYLEHSNYHNHMASYNTVSPAGSPAASPPAYPAYPTAHCSPLMSTSNFQTHPIYNSRRHSITSFDSPSSHASPRSDTESEGKEKGRCVECGKSYKDLKAHSLTHQKERPEKCPIATCEYSQKGFARKYDKNRHTLIHFKGTMVCGFCPGSGSAAEKSFNRADVFKRHLTAVHGVVQNPPNSRNRSPSTANRKSAVICQDATGKCSTCSKFFTNAQDFYEHLDDCVLQVVQQAEPSEEINVRMAEAMAGDQDVMDTMERHKLEFNDKPSCLDAFGSQEDDEDEDDLEDDEDDDEEFDPSFNARSGKGALKSFKQSSSSRVVLNGGITKVKGGPRRGMTWSKGGVGLVAKGRKKRKDYPPSWGMSVEKMQMKKRVLCVYDGGRRLWKDDLMMHNDFEVRVNVGDSGRYVTDLDIETLKRAEAIHNATEEEKGPWISEDDQLDSLMGLN